MPIHPSFQNHGNTLADALTWHYQQHGEDFVYRCINRLDRDTTGLLIVAKHLLSASILSDMVGKPGDSPGISGHRQGNSP